ncbi:hypothetical protein MSG28_014041 [Choristoneura fumiferana]|uniref:Uncharacterized protein n=1 Tax=Choristoneura fumiferana TaxID=7141 RepID=A0ACC0JFQ7_CHOFU|nr:hypothetical protein MSG28_014041 [Choristoneura fumiferana]
MMWLDGWGMMALPSIFNQIDDQSIADLNSEYLPFLAGERIHILCQKTVPIFCRGSGTPGVYDPHELVCISPQKTMK